jgi:hypothetical protein
LSLRATRTRARLVCCQRPFFLEDLPLGFRPRLRQPTQDKAVADDELTLPQELRLPSVALPVKAKFATPRHVIHADRPNRLAGRRLSWGGWGAVRAVERVVAHRNTIPGCVTEKVSGSRFSCWDYRLCPLFPRPALPRRFVFKRYDSEAPQVQWLRCQRSGHLWTIRHTIPEPHQKPCSRSHIKNVRFCTVLERRSP